MYCAVPLLHCRYARTIGWLEPAYVIQHCYELCHAVLMVCCAVPLLLCRYALTIGWLEPSYVIQRFLDAQRIQSLTGYLERLHAGVRLGDRA